MVSILLGSEQLGQLPHRQLHAHLHRAQRVAGLRGDLALAQPLEVGERDRLPLLGGQLVQRRRHAQLVAPALDLLAGQDLRRRDQRSAPDAASTARDVVPVERSRSIARLRAMVTTQAATPPR